MKKRYKSKENDIFLDKFKNKYKRYCSVCGSEFEYSIFEIQHNAYTGKKRYYIKGKCPNYSFWDVCYPHKKYLFDMKGNITHKLDAIDYAIEI